MAFPALPGGGNAGPGTAPGHCLHNPWLLSVNDRLSRQIREDVYISSLSIPFCQLYLACHAQMAKRRQRAPSSLGLLQSG